MLADKSLCQCLTIDREHYLSKIQEEHFCVLHGKVIISYCKLQWQSQDKLMRIQMEEFVLSNGRQHLYSFLL